MFEEIRQYGTQGMPSLSSVAKGRKKKSVVAVADERIDPLKDAISDLRKEVT